MKRNKHRSDGGEGGGKPVRMRGKARSDEPKLSYVALALREDVEAMVLAAGLFVAVCFVYRVTRYPDINGGDSGELLAAACSGGVAHPPGYPTYLMLASLFLRLPGAGANPHQRVAALSGLCSAGAATLLMVAVRRMYVGWEAGADGPAAPRRFRPGNWAGFLAGGAFAFSPLVWEYAGQAEVFALNNLLMAAIVLCLVEFAAAPCLPVARAGALLAGLALTNQHTIVLFLAPAIAHLVALHRDLLAPPRVLGQLAACSLLGLTPYLVLPLRAARRASYSWGRADTVGGFFTHLLRREYGTLRLTNSKEFRQDGALGVADTSYRMACYLVDFWVFQGMWVMLPAALAGCVVAWRRCRRGAPGSTAHRVLASSFLFYWVVFHALANMRLDKPLGRAVQARFWMQPNVVAFAYAGAGLVRASAVLRLPREARAALATALVLGQAAANWGEGDRSRLMATADFGRGALTPLPPNATLVVSGENHLLPVLYMQQCEGLRPDVKVVSKQLITYPWFKERAGPHLPGVVLPGDYCAPEGHSAASYTLGEFFKANAAAGPLYVLGGNQANHLPAMMQDPSLEGTGLTSWPEGLTEAVYNASAHPSPAGIHTLHQRAMRQVDITPENMPWVHEGKWEYYAVEAAFNALYRMSWRLMQHFVALSRPASAGKAGLVPPDFETRPWGVGDEAPAGPAEGEGEAGEGDDRGGWGEEDEDSWGMGGRGGRPVDREGQLAQTLQLAEQSLRFLEAVENQRLEDGGWVPWGLFDVTFNGYIYKHLGFIAQVSGNQEGVRDYYTKFLMVGPETDPNREQLMDLVRSISGG